MDVPTRKGAKPVRLHVDTVAEHHAIVDPYPFAVDPLVFSFPARLVPNRRYSDPDDFLREFYRAERITVTHTLSSA